MDDKRLNHQIFKWNYQLNRSHKNWCYRINKELMEVADIALIINNVYSKRYINAIITQFQSKLFDRYKVKWNAIIDSNSGVSGSHNGNKLRCYKQFKNEYTTEFYVKAHTITRQCRSALAKFRCGVAPLKIETGRYQSLPVHERTCFHCNTEVEDELHVLLFCPLYDDTRQELFNHAYMCNSDFLSYSTSEKFNFLLSDERIVKFSAKACNTILLERRNHLYK